MKKGVIAAIAGGIVAGVVAWCFYKSRTDEPQDMRYRL